MPQILPGAPSRQSAANPAAGDSLFDTVPTPTRAAALPAALAAYFATVLPAVRRQLAAWRRRAGAIPDPILRRQAQLALEEKGANPEAVAVFAILAPRRWRQAAVEAIVALQVAIDYLDVLGEQPAADRLADGLQLHRALPAAVTPGPAAEDWYRFHPRGEDGGYLSELVAACRRSFATLPAAPALQEQAAAAAWRCGQGQSHTHAAAGGDAAALERWARGLDAPAGYRWWEVAAGASSSVAAHALIAAAARASSTAQSAAAIDAAYFPPIGALTVLLDDLVDRERDAAGGEHSYLAYCNSEEAAGERLAVLAGRAEAEIAGLEQPDRHAAILSGVIGYYLGAEEARSASADPLRRPLLEASGPAARWIAALTRLRSRRK
jgi:tetraprenyl-beta-curcumene synthase